LGAALADLRAGLMGLMVKCLPCRHLGRILAKHDQTRAYHAQTGGPSKLFLFVSPPHKSIGCGSGMTCWRRLRDWQQDGIWDFIHFALLDWLSRDGQIDWSCAVVDSCSVRAVFGGC